jgi:hypothetical protein
MRHKEEETHEKRKLTQPEQKLDLETKGKLLISFILTVVKQCYSLGEVSVFFINRGGVRDICMNLRGGECNLPFFFMLQFPVEFSLQFYKYILAFFTVYCK